jgi:hypothetical protein
MVQRESIYRFAESAPIYLLQETCEMYLTSAGLFNTPTRKACNIDDTNSSLLIQYNGSTPQKLGISSAKSKCYILWVKRFLWFLKGSSRVPLVNGAWVLNRVVPRGHPGGGVGPDGR